MKSFDVNIGRSHSRNVQIRPDGIALQWSVCGGEPGNSSGCDGCQSTKYMIMGKLESKGIEFFPFDGYLVFAHPDNVEDPIEKYLSYILDYEVTKA